jgi:hypothetical protein
LTSGNSTRHSRDMKHTKRSRDEGGPIRVQLGPHGPTLAETLWTKPKFERLMEPINKFLARAGRSLDPAHRDALRSRIGMACLAYDGFQLSVEVTSRWNLPDARVPLDLLLDILRNEANIPDVLIAFGAPCTLALSPDREALGRAVAQLEILLDGLRKLARAIPPASERSSGRPSKTKDLRFLVHTLADIWEWATNQRFTYFSDGGLAGNEATGFVYGVLDFIAPERSRKSVIEKAITERSGELHPHWYKNPNDYNNSL